MGRVFKTTDGGTTWTQYTTGTTNTLFGICFVDTSNGWAVGWTGKIVVTTNGGTTWSSQTSPVSRDLYAVHFRDPQHGWITGTQGTILATTNGGSTWQAQSSGTSNDLRSLDVYDGRWAWAVGSGGAILATVTGGSLVPVREAPEQPLRFALYQNYPNPFNPATVIRFSLATSGPVTLEVFDILGRRVEVLVNERCFAGMHEVTFRGDRFASGVYFYRISAAGFTETKKLLLLK
jgi:hypothetical protein